MDLRPSHLLRLFLLQRRAADASGVGDMLANGLLDSDGPSDSHFVLPSTKTAAGSDFPSRRFTG